MFNPKHFLRLTRFTGYVSICFIVGYAMESGAQETEKFSNLQILPDDIERQKLFDLMGEVKSALGVSCTYCHARSKVDEKKMDYVSDEKATKEVARAMMLMTQKINATLMPDLGRTPVPEVKCMTCHHGFTQPRTLQAVLQETHEKDGIEAIAKRYKELRERYYGRGVFDFGELTLLKLSEALQKSSQSDEALFHLLQLNLEYYPESILSLYRLGKVYRDRGDLDDALRYFEKVLEISPDHHWAKVNVERLSKPQSEDQLCCWPE